MKTSTPEDSTSTLLHSAQRFFSGTLLSRFTGMFRDVAMAFAFGTQETVAAFMVAFRFSHLLRRLLGEGALQTAFIPHFEELRKEHPQRAFGFFRDLYGSLSLILLFLIGFTAIALGIILHFQWLSPDNQDILYLTLLMMPSLLFICLFGLNASLLQCEKKFFISSVAPVAFNLVWILGVLWIWKVHPIASMSWLAVAVIVACFFQWLVTLPQTSQSLRRHLGRNWWKEMRIHSPDLKALVVPLFCGVIGVAASQINNALDALFARYASGEGPAYLWYSIRLQQLPLALFGIAISSALLPPLTRAIKNHDEAAYRHFLEFTLKRSLGLMIPMTIGLFVLGDVSINLIYGHGHFGDESIVGTVQCLWAYTFGLVPMALVLIFAPAFYAQSNFRIPTIASSLSVVLNIGLNALLIMVLDYGAASVAFATSVSAWFNFIFLAVALLRQKGSFFSKEVGLSVSKTLAISVFAGGMALFVRQFFWGDSRVFQMMSGNSAVTFPHQFLEQVVVLGIPGIVFLGMLILGAYLAKAEDLQWQKG